MRVLTIFAALLALALPATATFDFEVVMEHAVGVGGLVEFLSLHGTLTNTGDERDTFDIHKDEFLPEGWTSSFCVGMDCYPAFLHDVDIMLNPSEQVVVLLDFQMTTTPGSGHDIVRFTSRGDGSFVEMRMTAIHENCDILIVDDSETGTDVTGPVLDNLVGRTAGVWPREDEIPALADLQEFEYVFWLTGSQGPSLDADDQTLVGGFLAGGGGLLLSGQDLAQNLCDPADPHYTVAGKDWCESVLGVGWTGDTAMSNVDGIYSDDLGHGLYLELDAGQTDPDILAITSGVAVISFQYVPEKIDEPAGILSTDIGRMVFLGFGLEGIVDPADLETLLERICLVLGQPTGSGEVEPAASLTLQGNHPNPFNPKTTILFEAPASGIGQLRVFDIRGRVLLERSLAMSAGPNSVNFEGRDARGRSLPSGLYLYQIRMDEQCQVGRMLLAK